MPWPTPIYISPVNPFPKAIPTRSAIASLSRSSISSSAKLPRRAWPAAQVRVACETLATTNRGRDRRRGAHLARREDEEEQGQVRGAQGDPRDRLRAGRFHWKTAKIDVAPPFPVTGYRAGRRYVGTTKDERVPATRASMFGYACRETPDLMPATLYTMSTRFSRY